MKKLVFILIFLKLVDYAGGQILVEDHNKAVDFIRTADTLIKNKNFTEAIPLLETALKLDSTIKSAYLLMHQACFYTGNRETSKIYLKKAQSIYTDDDRFAYYLGKVYQMEKNYSGAQEEFNKAIKLGIINGEDYPLIPDYYASRGICFLFQKKYKEALNDFNYSLKLNDSKGSVYANKGTTLYLLRRYEEACACWEKALKLGETSVRKYLEERCWKNSKKYPKKAPEK